MDKYGVVVIRDEYYEVKNAYVRWDDYSGGDSDWRGGNIHVFSNNPHGREVPKSVKEAVLKWCEHWLPTDRELSDSPGWRMEFEVKEWRETGYRAQWSHADVRPVLTDVIRDLMRLKAAKQVYVRLS